MTVLAAIGIATIITATEAISELIPKALIIKANSVGNKNSFIKLYIKY
jgi:hypothetical protein